MIGRGILQPLLEPLNTESLRLLLINTQIVKMSHAVFTYILIGWARAHPCPCLEPALHLEQIQICNYVVIIHKLTYDNHAIYRD